MRKRFFSLLLVTCLICAPVPVVFAEEFIPVTGEEMLENIMLGINIGNTLDATAYDMETGEYWMDTHTLETETIWGEVKIEQWHFQTIAQKGYTAVRIPVSWTGHTDENYIIDGEWMAHVRQAVDWALEEGLYVILNTHHEWETLYHFMGANADAEDYGEAKRWLTVIWEQIAGEFKDYSERLIFEPMNEPRPDGGWLGDAYSPASEILRMCGITGKLNADALDTIRQSGGNNAKRVVMLAVPQANAAWLKHMTTPGDPYIMMGVFLYPSGDDPKEQSDLELAAIKEAIDGGLPVMVKETAPIGERYTGEVRLDWVRHIHQALAGMGVPSFWWNTAGTEDSLFVRLNGEWIHKDWQDAVFAAYGKTPGPDAPLRSPFPYELSVDQKDGEFTFWQVPERVREAADKLVVECSEPLTGGYAFTKFSSDWVQFDNGDERVTEADDGTLTFDFRGLEGINIGFATWGEGDAAKITRAYIDTWEGTVPAEEPPPPAGTPSAWAADDVARAVGAGFVPEELQSAYEDSITRAEFCALAVGIYETYTGAEITERETFNDTGDVNVQKMAGLGVVSGNGGTFDPDGVFNRQMAARLLTNLLGAMDIHLKKAPVTFPDADSIADWALESVGQVQAAGLISGTGEGLFNPSGKFTRQSGIILMLNVWDYL
ncbi:MAG: cellulase family glycosylhydrolase, partial [Oscillospiraceae bacterium]|nr:cellulase family glycosylhydrolase [Oscillospiraceae bacterium]